VTAVQQQQPLVAPFPYFGGKRLVTDEVWSRFGKVKQYIEPFCGSAAILLGAPQPASLEVIGDVNMYVANFWRAVKYQPEAVWRESDYPVSHVDLFARHGWLTNPERRRALVEAMLDPEWPGDARMAGWWAWGQCAWIGSGWCDKEGYGQKVKDAVRESLGQVPFHSTPGMGFQVIDMQTLGQIPQADPGRGLQAVGGLGQICHQGNAGRGLQADGIADESGHRAAARAWIARLSTRLERVRIVHGSWDRCLNHQYGGTSTAVFLDPPYLAFEKLYAKDGAQPVAKAVEAWARDNAELRVALCGHAGDYDLPGWECLAWERASPTYGGADTKDKERIWFSPACDRPDTRQRSLFVV
jgi:hypothetical protein